MPRSNHRPLPTPNSKSDDRVVVVSQDTTTRRQLARLLLSAGFAVMTAQDAETARQLVSREEVDVVIADLSMTPLSGDALLHDIRTDHARIEGLLLVQEHLLELGAAAINDDVYDVLVRPWRLDEIVVLAVRRAVQSVRAQDELAACRARRAGKDAPDDLIGHGASMRQVRKMVALAQQTNVAVHLVGEEGTGRRLSARIIHAHGRHPTGPFIEVKPSGAPGLVKEFILGKDGALSQARSGALYIDGLQDISLDTQQELAAQLSGDGAAVRQQVRLFVGSTLTLAQLASRGQIHRDFRRLLQNLVVHFPPLRQRREDIPTLAHLFAHRAAQAAERPFERLSVDSLRLLRDYAWPGNVSELHDAMQQAVIWMKGAVMKPSDLVAAGLLGTSSSPSGSWVPDGAFDKPFVQAKKQVVDLFEQRYVSLVMQRAGGVVAEAARLSQMDRSNFRRLQRRARQRNG